MIMYIFLFAKAFHSASEMIRLKLIIKKSFDSLGAEFVWK